MKCQKDFFHNTFELIETRNYQLSSLFTSSKHTWKGSLSCGEILSRYLFLFFHFLFS